MILDADDVVLPEDRKKFKKLKKTLDPGVDMVMMKYNVGFDQEGNVTLSYYRERLSRRDKGFKWMEPVTRAPGLQRECHILRYLHLPQKTPSLRVWRNLRIYEKMIREGRPLSARGMYYFGRELYYNADMGKASCICGNSWTVVSGGRRTI